MSARRVATLDTLTPNARRSRISNYSEEEIWFCGLRATSCKLRAANYELQTESCKLRTANCGLRLATLGGGIFFWIRRGHAQYFIVFWAPILQPPLRCISRCCHVDLEPSLLEQKDSSWGLPYAIYPLFLLFYLSFLH